MSLTSRRRGATIPATAEYYVIPAPFPGSVALFSCACGALAVEYDVERVAPTGWSTADDGSDRCPECTAKVATSGSAPLDAAVELPARLARDHPSS